MNLKMCEKVASLYLRSALNEINTKMSKNSNTLSIHILFQLKVNSSEISRDISFSHGLSFRSVTLSIGC